MLTKQPLSLADFLSNLQTFDVVLMHGIFPATIISEEMESSPWSHVGIVVVAGDLIGAGLPLPGIDPATRLFWESNVIAPIAPTGQVIDVLLNAGKNGPQLTKLIDRMTFDMVDKYDSQFAGRKLMLPRTPAMLATLVSLIQQVHGDLFPLTADGQYGDEQGFQLGRFQNQQGIPNTFFCSQLTARTFMNLGILTRYCVDNSYCPADFSEAPDVSLLNGAWLGREIMLDPVTLPTAFPVPQPAVMAIA